MLLIVHLFELGRWYVAIRVTGAARVNQSSCNLDSEELRESSKRRQDSSWSLSNRWADHRFVEEPLRVARMGTSKRRRSDHWEAIARGLSSEEAGVVAGVSPAVGTRWFRENGGMPSSNLASLSGRYLVCRTRRDRDLTRSGLRDS